MSATDQRRRRRGDVAPVVGLGLVATLGSTLIATLGSTADAAPAGLGPTFEPSPIVGGVELDRLELDAVVAVRANGQLCTGTMVTPTVVLTAAHCLVDLPPTAPISVHFGLSADSAESRDAIQFGVHPQYCDPCAEERYDFGYIELSSPYEPSDGLLLPIVEQFEWNEAMRLGNVVLLAGFGTDNPFADGSPFDPLKRKVTTIINEFTSQGFEFHAGGNNRDTCSGDSGGPAIVTLATGERRLAGVTARGSVPCGDGGFYGVPFAALLWLRAETGADLLPAGCELADCLDISPVESSDGRCSVAEHPRHPGLAWLLLALVGLRTRRPPPRRSPRRVPPPT